MSNKDVFGYIYKIVNTENSKIYVGKTEETIKQRFKEHINAVKNGKKQSKLYSAMKCHGIDKFVVYKIDEAYSREELCEKEKYWIEKLNSRDADVGYNISPGGNGGRTWDPKGTVTMNKDNKNTLVYPEEVDEYLKNGWSLGGKKLGKATKKFRWVTDDNIQKRVPIDEVNNWLDKGWRIGYGNVAKENLSKSHLGIAPSNKGVPMSDDQKKKVSNSTKLAMNTPEMREKMSLIYESRRGMRWITNNINSLLVNEEDLDKYFNEGYILGRKKWTKGGDVNEKVDNNKN